VLPRKWGAHFLGFLVTGYHALYLNLGTLVALWPWALEPSPKIKILGFVIQDFGIGEYATGADGHGSNTKIIPSA
jgi:hypothetical protein